MRVTDGTVRAVNRLTAAARGRGGGHGTGVAGRVGRGCGGRPPRSGCGPGCERAGGADHLAALARHRHTRLVLAAGWVTDPVPYREDEEDH